ncbi:hypothetical protein AAMO2058_001336200 [Amorphochlora amoebiformis]
MTRGRKWKGTPLIGVRRMLRSIVVFACALMLVGITRRSPGGSRLDLSRAMTRRKRRKLQQRGVMVEKPLKRKSHQTGRGTRKVRIEVARGENQTYILQKEERARARMVPIQELVLGGTLKREKPPSSEGSEDSFYRQVKTFAREKRVAQLRNHVHVGGEVVKQYTLEYLNKDEQESSKSKIPAWKTLDKATGLSTKT